MQNVVALAGIAGALTVGAISPGPSFVMVARTAVASSRARALAAALGMGVGGLAFGAAALLGLQSVLLAVPTAYVALKVLGGLYLCYLGFRIFRSAREPLPLSSADAGADGRTGVGFWLGLTTQLSNPKTAIVYASVFAAFLPAAYTPGFALAVLAAVFLIEAGWYAVVALLLSSSAPQRVYLAWKTAMDRTAGAVMIGLGLRLVTSDDRP